ncbi:MAG: hypothetical protein K8R49_05385 [Candidatus Cloacimonetes bacterium]|nr:hypothetical protein [Candidatus Cloacimonadota bacterium]
MKRVIYLLSGILVLVLSACAVPTTYLMPMYKGRIIESKSLAIVHPDFFIENTKDVTDDLGEGDPKQVYDDFFTFNFKGRMSQLSTFSDVNFIYDVDTKEFKERSLTVGKEETIYIDLPKDGRVVKIDSLYADFVLFIQDYHISRVDGTSGSPGVYVPAANGMGGSWVGGGGGSFPDLRHTFIYAIWDNNEKQIVSYGKIISPTIFIFAMTRETWDSSITDIAKKILVKTPFENFPVNTY